mmetsp:Transcript_22456/g.44915  ORF Transcript_22456/g.44915 Transcript_22456/m.44915 type:complete len:88 (+) Transcript_22456:384-647(+)
MRMWRLRLSIGSGTRVGRGRFDALSRGGCYPCISISRVIGIGGRVRLKRGIVDIICTGLMGGIEAVLHHFGWSYLSSILQGNCVSLE